MDTVFIQTLENDAFVEVIKLLLIVVNIAVKAYKYEREAVFIEVLTNDAVVHVTFHTEAFIIEQLSKEAFDET